LKLVEKRAKGQRDPEKSLLSQLPAKGVTECINSGGTIEIAPWIAGHTTPSITRIYDRSGERVTIEEWTERRSIKNDSFEFAPDC
jgi:hypothetical protein